MGPGDVVADRFEIEAVAGTGGMGQVFRARDRLTGVPVAVKVLYLEGELERRRFTREARVLAELRHPGIVRYVAHGAGPDGEPYLVMEWLDGENLSQRLLRAPLDVAGSVEVVRRAADALSVAHARGTVHRDVKPSNLFLCGRDPSRVKVLDFGLARFGAKVDLTVVGQVLGTPSYMSPEQAQGRRDVDARSDVFALGCVLFRCLTGRAPFTGEDAGSTLARLLLEEAPRVRTRRPDISGALDDLLARMLARDPDARPHDGAEVAAALGGLGVLQGEGVASEHVAPALTQVEKRLVAVVVAGEAPPEDESTLVDRPSLDLTTLDIVRSIARAHGALVAQLHTERAVLTLPATGNASDLAIQAARCALALREAWAVPVAVAMGWTDGSSTSEHTSIAQRAAARLAEVTDANALSPRTSPVRLDAMTAGLLDTRFLRTGNDLIGEREVPPPRLLLGRETPCVGRDRELGMLEELFAECVRESSARVALVTAAPGIGKSRLRHELVKRVGEVAEVFIARAEPMHAGAPFGMLVAELRRAANIRDGEDPALSRQKVVARFGRNVAEIDRARVTMFLGELVGAPSQSEDVALHAARANPTLLGDQMRRAFEDWLAGECALRPVMLVLEDLHWGDLPTVRLVESALRNLAGRQLFVLALARPEVEETFPKLWSDVSLQGAGVQHIVLAPLGRRASEALVRDALGPGPSDELVAAVAARAGGNVFYLEELVRVASEGGKELPDTVLAMVQARTLALEPDVRRVLRAASVFGRRFWRGGVVALLGGPRSATLLDEWLGDLEEGELVTVQRESRFPGEREYVFRHDLVREAAYAMLTEDDRSLGHKLAAGWLEAAGEVQALPLAEHFERGGEGARAAAFYARAAIDALEGNDFAAAIDRTRRGVACGATGTLRGTLLRLRAEAHKWRAELEDSMGCALAAIDLLPLGTAAYFDAVADLAAACGRLGRPDVLAPVAESLEWVTPTLDARSRFVVAAAAVVVQRVYGGDAIGGARMRAKLDEVAARLPDDPVAQAWTHRVRSFTGLYAGDVSTYLVEGREAAACFDRVGDLRAATTLRAAVGYAHMQLGQWEEAERVLRASRAVAERMGLQTIITLVKHNLGMTLGRLGRWEEGKAMEAESVAESTAQRDRRIEAPARTYLAVLQLESGDPATALSTAEAAAKVADEGRPFALGVQADALLALGDLDGALARAMESQRVQLAVRGAGEEEGTLLALIVHAEALDRLGRRDEAREVLRKATRELATRAERIADPKWRESYVERVPVHVRIRARAREWAT